MTIRLSLPNSCAVFVRLKSYVAAIVFVIFLIVQHWMVFPYHDDWGLAVLDYVDEIHGFAGQSFMIHHVIEFLEGMYLHWSGRVTAFFIQIYLFKFGLEYVRLFQVGVILLIIWFSLRMASIKTINHSMIILPFALYLALPIFSVAGGLYWFSAASAYTWGIPVMLAGVLQLMKIARPSMRASALLGVAATFHEQMAVAVIVFYGVYVFVEYLEKLTPDGVIGYIIYSVPIIVGVLFNLLAPGNFVRLNNPSSKYPDGGVLEVTLKNLDAMSNLMVTQSGGKIYLSFFVISFVILAVKYVLSGGEISRKTSYFAVFLIAFTAISFYFPSAFFVLLLLLYGFLLFLLRKTNIYGNGLFALYAGAVSTLAILLLAPGVPGRALQSFYFIMFPVIVYSFSIFQKKQIQNYLIAIVLLLFPFALQNSLKIFRGYYLNYEVNEINQTKFIAARYDHAHGNFLTEPLILYKLTNPRFGETMPYDRPLIEKWIKKFYALPPQIQFIWK